MSLFGSVSNPVNRGAGRWARMLLWLYWNRDARLEFLGESCHVKLRGGGWPTSYSSYSPYSSLLISVMTAPVHAVTVEGGMGGGGKKSRNVCMALTAGRRWRGEGGGASVTVVESSTNQLILIQVIQVKTEHCCSTILFFILCWQCVASLNCEKMFWSRYNHRVS